MSLTPEQIAARKDGIGASEAAAALGMSAFGKTPLHVWASKVLPPEPEVVNPRRDFGHLAERLFIPRLYEEERGITLAHNLETFPGPAPLFATPDFIAPDRLVEAKNTGERMAEHWGPAGFYREWEPGVCPFDYYLQGQLQCLVRNFALSDLAVLIGGYDFRVLTFPFDEALALGALDGLRAFWREYVEPKVQPPIDGVPDAFNILRRRWPKEQGPVREGADATDLAAVERLLAAKEWKKQALEEEAAACARMAEVLGDAAGVITPLGKVMWTTPVRGRPDYKGLALQLGATPEQIAKFTPPGSRTMRATPAKGEVHDDAD